ncbi:MAG: electron transport complex subunit RsxG [Gammaproteobacteria bacterium]|nr:electron transport complex subunit RsxG [Gammaproteobacteria bacterium]MDH5650989.1 electron transport complex subunit RsxG [Gammaproteobacteria bacterium]
MHTLARNMLISAVLLGLFAIGGSGMVAWIFANTKQQIAANERATVLRNLHQLVPPETHDNDLFNDVLEIIDPQLDNSKEPVKVWRARRQGKPVAVIINSIAPDGYSGSIKLLVAIRYDGTLAGVRVVQHRETPGLGDGVDLERSNWILQFNNKSLGNPVTDKWRVKRDGGEFDQMTGATITPRAVIKAVRNTLGYFATHRDKLFATAIGETKP